MKSEINVVEEEGSFVEEVVQGESGVEGKPNATDPCEGRSLCFLPESDATILAPVEARLWSCCLRRMNCTLA